MAEIKKKGRMRKILKSHPGTKGGADAAQWSRVVSRLNKLPASFRQNSGMNMILTKGKRDIDANTRVTIYSWDAAVNCLFEECPASAYCHLMPDRESSTGHQKCVVQIQYTRQCANAVLNSFPKADEITLYQIGTHLIPLYSNLIRLKITELGVRRTTYVSNTGLVKMHPIYKELRDTHRSILNAWRDIGLRGSPQYAGDDLGEPKKDPKKGDASLYSRMMKSSQGGRK